MKEQIKEHITYTVDEMNGMPIYTGYFTNHPNLIVQADSIEDLLFKGDKMLRLWIDHSTEALNNGIELREVSHYDFMKK